RDFGGHGIGVKFQEDPFVPHYGKKGTGMVLVPGMVFTIEPMINEGDLELFVDEENEWTAYTEDGSLSAQWEYTILITEDGAEILSK
ncbi:MAG: M24 family metallopeptidase, partial [Clostridiaceae bacterium]